MKKSFQYIALLGVLAIAPTYHAQIKGEKLVLERTREPEVKKIEKKKTSVAAEKNYPPKEKAKDSLHYTITNIPLVSDFKTSTIQGEDISPKFQNNYMRNYFQIGYGNYGKFLADANISGKIQEDIEVGVDVHHLSTNGLKKEYSWDSKQQTTEANIYLNQYGSLGKLNIDAGFAHHLYNYYGNYQPMITQQGNNDLKQTYTQFGVNAYYDFYENNYLNNARLITQFTKDYFGANENFVDLSVNLSKHHLEINTAENISLNVDLGIGLKNQSTSFDILKKNESQHFEVDAQPAVTFFKDKHYLKIGSQFSILNSKYTALATAEDKINKTYWFPTAEIMIAAKDEANFYAGVDGGLKLNTYNRLFHENPYLISDLSLKPTQTKYHIYFGIKGDVNENFKYNLSGGFSKLKDMLFYQANPLIDHAIAANRNAYDYLNSFGVTYDNGTLSEVKLSAEYFADQNLNFFGELHYMSYDLDRLQKAYYQPVLQATLGANYKMLNDKLKLGFKAIMVGDRKTNAFEVSSVSTPATDYVLTEVVERKVGGYVDLNLNAEYKLHKNISIMVSGNNLTGKSYENYLGYKVLGAQVLGGLKFVF